MNLYSEDGWINVDYLMNLKNPYIYIVGARGIGKTYGIFDYAFKHNVKMMYIRRTQTILDNLNGLKGAKVPCKQNLIKYGLWDDFKVTKNEDSYDYYSGDRFLCTNVALSTFANIRSFDASDIDLVFYDEFIPEKHQISNFKGGDTAEFEAFANLLESVARNRELIGKKPIKLICAANANDGANAIFKGLKIVRQYTRMQKNNQIVYHNPQRCMSIIRYDASPISERKKQTSLYKMLHGTSFYDMAINNNAADINEFVSTRVNIKEYRPVIEVGSLMIYKHKSDMKWYVTEFKTGTPAYKYSADKKGLTQFNHDAYALKEQYFKKRVLFGEYDNESLFKEYLMIK